MSKNTPSFWFSDFPDSFHLRYCETESDANSMSFDRDDKIYWEGPGIYYTEKNYHHCTGDSYYKIYKMSNSDVSDLLSFCEAIKANFTLEQLIEKGWVDAEPIIENNL